MGSDYGCVLSTSQGCPRSRLRITCLGFFFCRPVCSALNRSYNQVYIRNHKCNFSSLFSGLGLRTCNLHFTRVYQKSSQNHVSWILLLSGWIRNHWCVIPSQSGWIRNHWCVIPYQSEITNVISLPYLMGSDYGHVISISQGCTRNLFRITCLGFF